MNQNQPLLLACWDINSCCSCWDTNSWGIPVPRFWRNPFFVAGLSARSWIKQLFHQLIAWVQVWMGLTIQGSAVFVHRTSIPIGFMVTFTIHIPQMLAYIPYMDPMGFSEIHGTVAKLAPNRIPWCLKDDWKLLDETKPQTSFLKVRVVKIYENHYPKRMVTVTIGFPHTLSLSLSLSLYPLYVFVFVLAPWFIIYGYLPVSNWPAVESCWCYGWFHSPSFPQCWTVLRRHISVGSICDMFRALI